MRIECNAMKLELKVRGSPKVKGELITFVRSLGKRHVRQRKLRQIECFGNSYYSSHYRSVS